ncbi:iron-siderophore ABC transporter substrate-binding protein [Patulibacter minatonensis]|uniref:iron-siderophore ABC transporter substrate-binding protein n=1 Tax=Patulibacter minatonensis TaxID=298163 RepID=UPI00047C0B0B|nr:iron-siderophore ABC transporter substrate-binding protein [Patulibacter minatonensis]
MLLHRPNRSSAALSRPFLLLLALAAVLGLAACGSSDAGGVEGGTRSYTDARGTKLELPARPQRIVALSEPTLDAAVALGAKPIATTAGRGQGTIAAYLQQRAGNITSVGILGQPNIERIAALRPDVILIDGTATPDDSIVDKLSKFAPTVFVSKNGADWKQAFVQTADVLGRQDEGKKLTQAYDDRIASIRAKLGKNAGAEISIVRWGGIGLPAVLKSELAAPRVLNDLGLTRPSFQRGRGPGHTVPVSLERIDALDGDWIFFGALGSGGAGGGVSETPADVASAKKAIGYAKDTPGFTDLKAYKAGHVVPVDGSAWTSAGGYLAEQLVLDDIERTLAGGAAR